MHAHHFFCIAPWTPWDCVLYYLATAVEHKLMECLARVDWWRLSESPTKGDETVKTNILYLSLTHYHPLPNIFKPATFDFQLKFVSDQLQYFNWQILSLSIVLDSYKVHYVALGRHNGTTCSNPPVIELLGVHILIFKTLLKMNSRKIQSINCA